MLVQKKPEISVIMCIYNESKDFLIASIESILNQSFSNFEFIIINDNPKKELNKNLLKEYSLKDERIIVVNNIENKGLTKSLNIGLKLCIGDFIARMDADDVSLSCRFKKQIQVLKNNVEIGICGSSIKVFSVNTYFKNVIKYPKNQKSIKTEMLFSNPIVHPSVMFKRNIFEENKNLFYNEELKRAQDYDLWFRASKFTNFFNINRVLLNYRVSEGQISSIGKKEQEIVANDLRGKLLSNLFDVSLNEILLHNRICNRSGINDLAELGHLENWFDKLYINLSKNNLFDRCYLQNKLNYLLQDVYLNLFLGLKCFDYLKTKTYIKSNNKLKHLLFFVIRFLIRIFR